MNKSLALATALLLSGGLAVAATKPPAKTVAQPAVVPQPVQPVVAAGPSAPAAEAMPADHVVALVNSEPITNHEVHARLARLQPPTGGAQQPPRAELLPQVMERLILERAMLQAAAEQGLRIDAATLTQAEENIARQNGLSVEQLHVRLKATGQDAEAFRADLRNEMLLQRLREREVDNRIRIGEPEIDAYLAEHQSPELAEINLAQLLVRVPEDSDDATVERLRQRAEQLAQRARSGADFAALVRESSDAADKARGGELGLRGIDRYPGLFVDATRSLLPGQVAEVVRSGAGFHVLKLLDKHSGGLSDAVVTQTRVRHILLRPGAQLSQDAALARLQEMRQHIAAGSARFEELARQHSQDGSASAGGDLGWAQPGMFVPEFEQVMNQLAPGQLSEPLVSRFGVHLIQVQERRQVPLSARELREWVRNILREQKSEQAYETWARELRGRAYIEYREPPQ
ncbi:peptidylprolyl isomerase [Malikia sp.]|uniref:peptidylprolyl isomerase n=1 Tax=Malikia sp. TaxID=2070706 RepID=UPI00260A6AA9|nr:peptidylprolyl isomerase [Malikia sp.]MDD2729863.1 peptidylprolyl isomerase [Malikia sp.]